MMYIVHGPIDCVCDRFGRNGCPADGVYLRIPGIPGIRHSQSLSALSFKLFLKDILTGSHAQSGRILQHQELQAADGAAALKRHGDSHISHVTVL